MNISRETTVMEAEDQETYENDIESHTHQNYDKEEKKRESDKDHYEEEEEIFSPVDINEEEIFSPVDILKDEIFSPVERNDMRDHGKADGNDQLTPKKRKMKRSETKYEESTESSAPSTKTSGGRNRNRPNNNNSNKARRNSDPQSLENNILRWSKEEKDLLRLKEKLLKNNVDFGDYSILMYETQDAFNHCRNLRLQLQISDQQVRLKTKQCNSLMAQREEMKRAEHQRKKIAQDREVVLKEKLRKTEQRLIDVYGENEWLQGIC